MVVEFKYDADAEPSEAAETVLFDYQDRVSDLAAEFTSGSISSDEFVSRGDELVTAVNETLARIACGGGGIPEVRADVAARTARQKEHVKWLADALISNAANVGLAVFSALPRNTFEESLRRAALYAGCRWERRVVGDGGCCADCRAAAAMNWQPLGSLPEVGDTPCLTDCTCHFEYSSEPQPDGRADFGLVGTIGRKMGLLGQADVTGGSAGEWWTVQERDANGRWTSQGGGGGGTARTPFEPRGVQYRDDFSLGNTAGQSYVHADNNGHVDHGPAHLLGKHISTLSDMAEDGKIKLKLLPYQGDPHEVAHADVSRTNFNALARREIENVDQQQRLNGVSAIDRMDTRQALSRAAAELGSRDQPPAGQGPPPEVRDVSVRDQLIRHARANASNTGLFHADSFPPGTPVANTLKIKGVDGPAVEDLHRAVQSPDATAHPRIAGVVSQIRQGLSAPGKTAPNAARELAGAVRNGLTDEEANHLARHMGITNPGRSFPGQSADVETASQLAQRIQDKLISAHNARARYREAASESLDASRAGMRRGDVAGAAHHVDLLHRHAQAGGAGPEHVDASHEALKKKYTLSQLKEVAGNFPRLGDVTGMKTKAEVVSHLLAPAKMLTAKYADVPDDASEIGVTFDRGTLTASALIDHLTLEGLSEEAIEAVLDHCEPAETDDNDRLLPAACFALSMRIQSLLFPTDEYTEAQVHAWCKENDYEHGKIDTTDNYHRVRQFDPDQCKGEPRTIAFKKSKGVKAVVCLMPARDDSADHSAGDGADDVELVYYNGNVWDSESVLYELIEAGFGDMDALEALGSFERYGPGPDFKKEDDAPKENTDENGRPFIWRHLHGSNVRIYTDGQEPSVSGPSWIADKMNSHGIVKTAAAESGDLPTAQKVAKIAQAAKVSGARAKQEAVAEKAKEPGALRRVSGKLAAGARNIGAAAGKAVGRGAVKAAQGAKVAAAAVREKGVVGAVASGARRVAQTNLGQRAMGASATLQALGAGGKKVVAISLRGVPVKQADESSEDFKRRQEEYAQKLSDRMKSFTAARVEALRKQISEGSGSWASRVSARWKLLGNTVKGLFVKEGASLEESRKEEAAEKKQGALGTAKGIVRSAASYLWSGMGYLTVLKQQSGQNLMRQLRQKYPGMTGKAAVALSHGLNGYLTAAGIVKGLAIAKLSLGAAGAAVTAVSTATGVLPTVGLVAGATLAVGAAAVTAVKVANFAMTGKNRLIWAGALMEATAGAGSMAGRAIRGSRIGQAAAKAGQGAKVRLSSAWNWLTSLGRSADHSDSLPDLPVLDPELVAIFSDDDDGPITAADIPDDFDWGEAFKMAAAEVSASFTKFGHWLAANKSQFEDGARFIERLDIPEQPVKDMLANPPKVVFSCDDPGEPLLAPDDDEVAFVSTAVAPAAARASFLKTLAAGQAPEVMAAARAEVNFSLEALDADYGNDAATLALAGAVTAPTSFPGPAGALAAALGEAYGTFKGGVIDGPPEGLSRAEAVECGRFLAEALAAGWLGGE
jgi:hypothetical protein